MQEDNKTVTMVVGFVGHCSHENVSQVKKLIEATPGLRVVLFKASSTKLWIKEGESP